MNRRIARKTRNGRKLDVVSVPATKKLALRASANKETGSPEIGYLNTPIRQIRGGQAPVLHDWSVIGIRCANDPSTPHYTEHCLSGTKIMIQSIINWVLYFDLALARKQPITERLDKIIRLAKSY